MFDRLKSLFSNVVSEREVLPADTSSIAPNDVLLVVGDVHGSFELLQKKFVEVDAFLEENEEKFGKMPQLVFVGDYIDRGENSAEVLSWVFDLQQELPHLVTCLMGNHERMMIDFLDDPAGRGARWLRNGGLQTLASFKIGEVHERSDVEELTEASHALENAMPTGMLTWLRGLDLSYQSGNVCVVHAAMDPHLGIEDQLSNTLLWGHNEFMTRDRDDGNWVVHGHTIVREPEIRKSRISIDTGAYHSGQLTVAVLSTGSCVFV
ncbi:MAG: metallophosphoesterase family protein [Sulfitobacter sp.]